MLRSIKLDVMLNYLKNIDLSLAYSRFPISLCYSILCAVILFRFIYLNDVRSLDEAFFINAFFISFLLFLSSIIIRLCRESYDLSFLQELVYNLIGLLFGVYAYFSLLPYDFDLNNTRVFRFPFYMIGLISCLHLVISFVPFIKRGTNRDFWEYNKRVFLQFVESGFFTIFLFASLSLAIAAVQNLFDLDIDGKIFGYLAVFLGGIFHSTYFLSKYPTIEYDNNLDTLNRPFLVFVQFILIPVTVIYMSILFAYGLKIGFSWNLPKGWVAQLSLWFSIMGLFTYLMNYFSPEFGNKLFVRLYQKYFFIILTIPTLLLFISIYRRLSDYGVTELRYVIALVGVWLLLLILVYGFKLTYQLKWIPLSLSIFIIFALFAGPINMFDSTLSSQISRFNQFLQSEDFFVTDSFKDITNNETKKEVTSSLRFLDRRSDMQWINNWVKSPITLVSEDSLRHVDKSNAQIIAEHFGLDKQEMMNLGTSEYFNYNSGPNIQIDIRGYDELIKFDINFYLTENDTLITLNEEGQLTLQLSSQESIIDIGAMLNQLAESKANHTQLDIERLTLEDNLGNEVVKIAFNNIGGKRSGGGIYKIEYAQGILLIKNATSD